VEANVNKQGIRYTRKEDFDACAIWYYEEESDLYYPITSPDEIPDYADPRDLTVKALFHTPSGSVFDGYIVLPRDTESKVFSIGIFVNERQFFFNNNLPGPSKEQLEDMIKELNSGNFRSEKDVFPVRYETNFSFEGYNNNNFQGMFDAFRKIR
jgi:hypothetical protein